MMTSYILITFPGLSLKCFLRNGGGRGESIGLQQCEDKQSFACRIEGDLGH